MSYDHISYFDYVLPEALIAQYPLPERSASRLLMLNVLQEAVTHQNFMDLTDILQPHDLLVVNDTKVFPARLYGQKSTGGHIECLIERVLSEEHALVHLKSSKSPKQNTCLKFSEKLNATVVGREGDLFLLAFDCDNLFDALEEHGIFLCRLTSAALILRKMRHVIRRFTLDVVVL